MPWERVLERLEQMQKNVQGTGNYFQSHRALMHHRHLILDLASLTDGVRMRTINRGELLNCLELCDRDVDGFDNYFKDELSPIYWNVRRTQNSSMALKVFGIPELLQCILSNCDIPDVLHAYETCTGVRDIIEASSQLQTHLCLRPAADCSAQ